MGAAGFELARVQNRGWTAGTRLHFRQHRRRRTGSRHASELQFSQRAGWILRKNCSDNRGVVGARRAKPGRAILGGDDERIA